METSIQRSGDRPDLSVVIVNRNTRDLLEACLRSLADTANGLRLETIVVDNGSSDGSPEMVEREFTDIRLIRNASNTGFAFPNNQGIRESRGRHVMLLNSDTVVLPGALDRLVRFLDDHPHVAACAPRLLYPDGRLQPSCFSFLSPWKHACDMLVLDRLFPRSRLFGNQNTWFDYASTAEIDWPMAAALVVRREVIDAVGPLDEQFSIHCNDTDWCFRMRAAGWSIYYVREAEIVHYWGATTERENGAFRMQGEMLRNYFDYFRKHFGRRGIAWFRILLVVGFAPRILVFGVLARFRPSERAGNNVRFFRGMLRAGWTGDPDQFAV
jgi:GT2 family glycosyltransferase